MLQNLLVWIPGLRGNSSISFFVNSQSLMSVYEQNSKRKNPLLPPEVIGSCFRCMSPLLGKLGSALGEGLAFCWGVCAWALSVAPGAVRSSVRTAGEENL